MCETELLKLSIAEECLFTKSPLICDNIFVLNDEVLCYFEELRVLSFWKRPSYFQKMEKTPFREKYLGDDIISLLEIQKVNDVYYCFCEIGGDGLSLIINFTKKIIIEENFFNGDADWDTSYVRHTPSGDYFIYSKFVGKNLVKTNLFSIEENAIVDSSYYERRREDPLLGGILHYDIKSNSLCYCGVGNYKKENIKINFYSLQNENSTPMRKIKSTSVTLNRIEKSNVLYFEGGDLFFDSSSRVFVILQVFEGDFFKISFIDDYFFSSSESEMQNLSNKEAFSPYLNFRMKSDWCMIIANKYYFILKKITDGEIDDREYQIFSWNGVKIEEYSVSIDKVICSCNDSKLSIENGILKSWKSKTILFHEECEMIHSLPGNHLSYFNDSENILLGKIKNIILEESIHSFRKFLEYST